MEIGSKLISAASILGVLLFPGSASASMVLDTGTPTSLTGAPVSTLSTAQFLAAEFSVAAGQDITSLAAYLTQGAGSVGDTFTFDIYANTGFTSRPSSRPVPVYTIQGTFTANGWNSTATNWVPTAGGNYWLALQVGSTTNTKGLSAPGAGISTTSGTAPALAFAYTGSSGQYVLSSAAPVALEVVAASPVPLPATAWLLGSGLIGFGAVVRRAQKRTRA